VAPATQLVICNKVTVSSIRALKRPFSPPEGFAFWAKNDIFKLYIMTFITSAIFYIVIFTSVYVQVFFLVTFLQNRKKIFIRDREVVLSRYPRVTIIVPCWNEETTIYKTIRSLLNLNYPKDKITFFLIDDGSTDGTWHIIEKFEKYANIKIFHKENGGKYTALNFGLENTETEFVGCLDADSIVDKEALRRIFTYFEKDASIMAVAPAVVVNEPKGILQNAQRVEYNMGIYFKKMLGFLGAINVTPGPFTIFRKKVFDDLGPYKHAHNTEDMEIAYRMQKNHYKIEHCNDAYVYTNTPVALNKLFKQRLRWIYGFINNTLDYRAIVLDRKYGNFSLFTLPTGSLTVLAVVYVFFSGLYNIGQFIYSKILEYQIIGFHFSGWPGNFDFFFINTQTSFIVTIGAYSMVIFAIIFGKQMTRGTKEKWGFPYQVIYYFVVFSFIAPFWIMNAVYNTLISRTPAWR